LKLNPIKDLINGRRVVLVDDSIVRGTTSKKLVEMVREAGAKEVHLRISCPPTTHSCYYGVDTPRTDDLIASRFSTPPVGASTEELPLVRESFGAVLERPTPAGGVVDVEAICRFIGADSLGYLSLDGMLASIGLDPATSCTACWTGKYPTLLANSKAA
jgi:amidophosphoribosyltransferase